MKSFLVWSSATSIWAMVALSTAQPANPPKPDTLPPGSINVSAASVPQILDVYQTLTGLQLFISSEVNRVNGRVTINPTNSIKLAELPKLYEDALITQTGVVITRLEGKKASVTYNDSLPVMPASSVRKVPVDCYE